MAKGEGITRRAMTKGTMKARKMAKAKGDRQIGGKIGRVPLRAPQATRRRQSEKTLVGVWIF
jgi:hypothetical protein